MIMAKNKEKMILSLKKIGGSVYCLIPAGLVEELQIQDAKEILISLEKVENKLLDLARKFKESKEDVYLMADGVEYFGKVKDVNGSSINFQVAEQNYIIPFDYIEQLFSTKSEEKTNEN